MKIAHLELGRHLYGGAAQLRYLLEAMHGDDHQHVLVAAAGSAIHEWAQAADQPAVGLAYAGEHDLGFIVRLARLLRARNIDLLHVHSRRGADWMGPLAAKLGGARAIISRRVDNVPGWPLRLLLRFAYARVICISEAISDVLRQAGVNPATLMTIRSAVDAERFARPAAADARARLRGDDRDGPVIAMIAQMIERKGHHFALDILPGLVQRFTDLKLCLLGRGPLEAELRRAVAARGLERHVEFYGFADDLDALLPAIDVVLHPATAEGLGVSLLQAAAAGVPVVAFAAGGVVEAVADQHSGILVPSGDTIALAAATGRLLNDDALRRTLGDNARRRAQRDFSIATMARRHAALYDVLAGELT